MVFWISYFQLLSAHAIAAIIALTWLVFNGPAPPGGLGASGLDMYSTGQGFLTFCPLALAGPGSNPMSELPVVTGFPDPSVNTDPLPVPTVFVGCLGAQSTGAIVLLGAGPSLIIAPSAF